MLVVLLVLLIMLNQEVQIQFLQQSPQQVAVQVKVIIIQVHNLKQTDQEVQVEAVIVVIIQMLLVQEILHQFHQLKVQTVVLLVTVVVVNGLVLAVVVLR